ncbi:hypothetical protein CVT25_014350 [Psilocybe cyanescens]|uniref:Uncharacterized protein n=1 Tax=Psilocybe cyanescens TaxID=93625 RepID=A0A409XIG3_PSICY|nr:hypothetical protein CVT25_014350 [Psilocybe cyanescens]
MLIVKFDRPAVGVGTHESLLGAATASINAKASDGGGNKAVNEYMLFWLAFGWTCVALYLYNPAPPPSMDTDGDGSRRSSISPLSIIISSSALFMSYAEQFYCGCSPGVRDGSGGAKSGLRDGVGDMAGCGGEAGYMTEGGQYAPYPRSCGGGR